MSSRRVDVCMDKRGGRELLGGVDRSPPWSINFFSFQDLFILLNYIYHNSELFQNNPVGRFYGKDSMSN